jgi:Zn-finger nucleic acid-binding protein
MVVFELHKIELDYCPVCFGVWFDAGEIELLLRTESAGTSLSEFELERPKSPVIEAKRPCPLCRNLMIKMTTPNQDIIIDQCPNNEGFWFDRGEVVDALRQFVHNEKESDITIRAVMAFLGDALSDG